ncbi:MAG: PDZ domain-containing protein [Akkermansia sp.]
MKACLIILPLVLFVASCHPRSADKTSIPPEDKAIEQASRIDTPQAQTPQQEKEQEQAPASPTVSLALVQSTNQTYNQIQPWAKNEPEFSSGFALYLGDNLFLTTANTVSATNFVELVSPDGSQTASATVAVIDEGANLALLRLKKQEDASFTEKMIPLVLGESPSLNDHLELWQFNNDGLPIISEGTLQSTVLDVPFTNNISFILYDIKSVITPTLTETSIPIMSKGQLIGISLTCKSGSQKVLSISLPVIKQFIDNAAKATQTTPYQGFPAKSITTNELTDPVFRTYLGLEPKGGGVFISEVVPRSDAAKAGILKGDVLESIDGIPIDARGIIKDDKLGPVHYSVLLHDTRQLGDIATLGIKRKGQAQQIKLTLDRSALTQDIIARIPSEQQPDYIIYGGIIFQPMSYPLLEAVSPGDNNKASMEMIEATDKKEEYVKAGCDEIILVTNVLPTKAALGYASLAGSILQKVNGIRVKNLRHLGELLDQVPTNGIICIETNKSPYRVYLSQKEAQESNRAIETNAIPILRYLAPSCKNLTPSTPPTPSI